MTNRVLIFSAFLVLVISNFNSAQEPPRPPAPPKAPRPGMPPAEGAPMGRPGGAPQDDWFRRLDTNGDRTVDQNEFRSATDFTFAKLDKNGNGVIDPDELVVQPRGGQRMPPEKPRVDGANAPKNLQGRQDPQRPDKMLPPFFFRENIEPEKGLSRTEFDDIVNSEFTETDTNKDGVLSIEEMPIPRPPNAPGAPRGPNGPPPPPPPPNAQFIGAEMRFGDKYVPGQPFSAETVFEDTRRLFDGTTATKENKGYFYRDSAGRTRREHPLQQVGGFGVVGADNKPQTLVFISDFSTKSQYFLNDNEKIARKSRIGNARPEAIRDERPGGKTESLGTKTIEGVSVEGTRTTFEIPAGQFGNDKPIEVISEKWFSPELQVIVMSRHLDPLAGEHIFKLVNIKRAEPAASLFAIPSGYRIEGGPGRAPRE